MTTRLAATVAAATLFAITHAFAADAEKGTLIPQLEPLRPFLGRTFRGELKPAAAKKDAAPAKPNVDVVRYERALNGQAVRVVHSINDGAYGGEILIYLNMQTGQLTYHYITTAGFQTHGTMTLSGRKFESHETVTGDAGGVTEVRAKAELRDDGTIHLKSEYLRDGAWVPARESIYTEDPKAEVKFK